MDSNDPERIIVFGSMAENNIHGWNDIDLLVVKRTSKRPLERVLELGRLVKICSFCDVRRMTKFLIDENVPPTIADLLRNLELDFTEFFSHCGEGVPRRS